MNRQKALDIFELTNLDGLSLDSLKTLYKKLAKNKHPDQGGSDNEFIVLKEAYGFLQDEIKAQKLSTDLKEFGKEEILDNYNQDKKSLENKITLFQKTFDNQIVILNNVKSETQEILEKFENQKKGLQKELEEKINRLEKNYSKGFLQKLLFFLPRMSQDEFWVKYKYQVEIYSQKYTELDIQFFKKMLEIYGDGLNEIAEKVNKI